MNIRHHGRPRLNTVSDKGSRRWQHRRVPIPIFPSRIELTVASLGAEWEAVPLIWRENCAALGICTVWSALDWSRIMMVAVDAELDRALPRHLIVERATLKAEMVVFLGEIDVAELKCMVTAAASQQRVIIDALRAALRGIECPSCAGVGELTSDDPPGAERLMMISKGTGLVIRDDGTPRQAVKGERLGGACPDCNGTGRRGPGAPRWRPRL